ncbi:MAG: MFS transporter [Chloroflexi bacterium]|nr:MFS transporter [Chloroflexota bacterium]
MAKTQAGKTAGPSLWRDRDFLNLWLAQFTSSLVMGVTTIALPWLVLDLTGSPAQTALMTTFLSLPYFILSIPAGALADRFNRRSLMLSSMFLRGVVFATIPLAALVAPPNLIHLYVAAAVTGALRAVFDGANFGALLNVVGRERLADANSKLSASFSVSTLIGPQVAGILIASVGAAMTLSVTAIGNFFSYANIRAIRRPFSTGASDATDRKEWRFWDDIKEGARFVWQTRLIRILTLLGFGNGLTGGGIHGLLVVFARQGLGLREQETGLIFAAGGVGAIAAMLLLPRLLQRYPVVRLTLWGLTLNAILIWPFLLAPNFAAALVAYALWQGTFNLILINGLTIRQQLTPDRLQGRVNTVGRAIASGGMPLGAAIGGLLAEWLGIRAAYGILALGVATSAMLAWLSPLRSFEVFSHTVAESGTRPEPPPRPAT